MMNNKQIILTYFLLLFALHLNSTEAHFGANHNHNQHNHDTDNDDQELLTDLLNDRFVTFGKFSSVLKLIKTAQLDDTFKESENLQSFLDLKPILKLIHKGQVCDLDLVNLIADYHDKYISDEAQAPVAISIRLYFESLCQQVSAECKMSMINNLEHDTKVKLKADDFVNIRALSRMGIEFNPELEDFDDVVLTDSSDSIRIKATMIDYLTKLTRDCELKFRPFYEKLILPLVELSNIGYNYEGEILERELKELKQNSYVHEWYVIVQTCEGLRSIDIYEWEESDSERLEMDFLSSDEEEKIETNAIKSIREIVAHEIANSKRPVFNYVPIVSQSDDLWITGQNELGKLMNYKKPRRGRKSQNTSNNNRKHSPKMAYDDQTNFGGAANTPSGSASGGGLKSLLDKTKKFFTIGRSQRVEAPKVLSKSVSKVDIRSLDPTKRFPAMVENLVKSCKRKSIINLVTAENSPFTCFGFFKHPSSSGKATKKENEKTQDNRSPKDVQ